MDVHLSRGQCMAGYLLAGVAFVVALQVGSPPALLALLAGVTVAFWVLAERKRPAMSDRELRTGMRFMAVWVPFSIVFVVLLGWQAWPVLIPTVTAVAQLVLDASRRRSRHDGLAESALR